MVDNDVEAEDFKAQVPVPRGSVQVVSQDRLHRNDSLYHQVINLLPDFIKVEPLLLERFDESF